MSASHTATSTACGWWALAPGGFRTEAFCSLDYGHAGEHEDAYGIVDLPTDAERIGDMCARFDEDDSGTLCAREPGHPGLCRNRSGYVFEGVENDDTGVPGGPINTPAFRACEVPECAKRRYHEGVHEDTGGRVVGPCAARRPGYEHGPAWGRRRLPCVLDRDHDGPHRNTYRDTWNGTDVPDHPHNTAAQEAGRVRHEQTAEVPGVELVPAPEMFPEAIDGEPVMYRVRSTDTRAQVLGTVAASDDLSAWLPLMPDGGHGPLAPTARSGAVWLARARVRMHASGTSPVLPCPVSGCALLAGHSGRCMDLDGREWKGHV